MNKSRLTPHVLGTITVKAEDVANLARIVHRLRQEIGDQRLPINARTNYADMIKAVDYLIMNAGSTEEE